jgi:hypothetical protein
MKTKGEKTIGEGIVHEPQVGDEKTWARGKASGGGVCINHKQEMKNLGQGGVVHQPCK